MSTGSSPSGFDDSFPEDDLVLPDDMREELAKPTFGTLTSADGLEGLIAGSRRVICVGDMVTVTLLDMGKAPDVAVFDYRTQRSENPDAVARIAGMSGTLVQVANPPGMITKALWRAVRDAVRSSKRTKIKVDGEEDLAALVAIAMAPEGAHVIYGLPQRGLMVVRAEDSARAAAAAVISRMTR